MDSVIQLTPDVSRLSPQVSRLTKRICPKTITHSLAFLKNISNPAASDKELVLTYQQNGDLQVLASLYQRYMELVYGVCLKYLQDTEPAKDAVMQVFEELVQKLKKHEVDNFKSWL